MAKPEASIIIPSRGMEEGLRKLFAALALELAGKNVEVILVDDGSEPPLAALEAEFQGRLHLRVVRQDPKGPAAARNAGLKNSSSELVVFLDSDVLPLPGWFSALTRPLLQEGSPAGVEGKTVSHNLEELNPFSHYLENLEGGVYLTCNIAYRREWIERAGGFDERFKHPWREDSDLAFGIMELGGKIIFEPNAMVNHPVRPVNLWRLFWFYPTRRGYDMLFYRKHPKARGKMESSFADLSELSFLATLAAAAALFALGWPVAGLAALLFHQAIYHNIFLRKLHFGARAARNLAVPWKVFAKAYPFFWPSTILGLAGLAWGWIRFAAVKPRPASGGVGK